MLWLDLQSRLEQEALVPQVSDEELKLHYSYYDNDTCFSFLSLKIMSQPEPSAQLVCLEVWE